MRLRIHHALFVGFMGVIGLLVALTLVLVGSGLNRELSATFEAELERQLRLGVALMERSDGMDADELARLITARIDYRVTIIDTAGPCSGSRTSAAPGSRISRTTCRGRRCAASWSVASG
jgi:hypothetical protein